MKRSTIVCAAVMALALSGCARETTETTVTTGTETAAVDTAATTQPAESTETVASTNPCASLPAADVTTIMGMTMAQHPGDNDNGCSYRSEDDKVKVILRRMDAAGYDLMAQQSGVEQIAGLGEKAIWDGSMGQLLAVKGENMLDVTYDEAADLDQAKRATPEQKKERVLAIAQKVMPAF